MKKRTLACIAIVAVGCAVCVSVISAMARSPEAVVDPIQKAIDDHNELSRIAEDVAGFAQEETYSEQLIGPETYADSEGRSFSYWICLCWNAHLRTDDSERLLYREAFDPATAESSHEVAVNDGTGTVYQKDGRAYIMWSVVVDGIERLQLLDCDPVIIDESEMIEMAESCEK